MENATFKTIQILLTTNIKDHRTIIYTPKMSIPSITSTSIYFMPTVPIDLTDIQKLDPKLNLELKEEIDKNPKLATEYSKYSDLKENNIMQVFLNPKMIQDVVQFKINAGNKSGNPVAPKQFNNKSQLLNGKIVKLNGKLILKTSENYFVLHNPQPSYENLLQGFQVNTVMPTDFKVGSRITVTNGVVKPKDVNQRDYTQNRKDYQELSFVNNLKPLTIQQASRKGIIANNINFIIGLLFGNNKKLYFNGNPNIPFPIHSYRITHDSSDSIWKLSESNPNTFIVNVDLTLMPIIPPTKRKDQIGSTKQSMDCIFRKEKIMEDFHTLFGNSSMFKLSDDALVEVPKNLRNDAVNRQMTKRPNTRGGTLKIRKKRIRKTRQYRK